MLGIDIDGSHIKFARRNVESNLPELASIVSFHEGSLEELAETFDVVVSKDSFEHIEDLPTMMLSIAAHLNDGGVLVVGFSPMYYSPFGDHGRYFPKSTRRLPWMPLIPEPLLFRMASHGREAPITSSNDLGLNKLTPKAFREIVHNQRWEVLEWHTNRGGKRGMKAMASLAKIRPLEKFFTVNVYAVLRKPAALRLSR